MLGSVIAGLRDYRLGFKVYGFRSYRVIGLRVSGLGWFAGLGFRGYGFGISGCHHSICKLTSSRMEADLQ